MKRMMEKGKGKRRTLTKCRANKRRRFAALSTREAEETEVESPMKRMMEKGERGNAKHRRIIALTKKQRSVAQCTSVTEKTKADVIKPLAAHGGSTRATCFWLLLLQGLKSRDLSRISNEKDDGKGKGETQNTDEMSR